MWRVIPFLILLSNVETWNLSSYNISSNYFVSSISVYGSRAFLALPRSSCFNNVTSPTLVEVSWYSQQAIFPRRNPFFLEAQDWNDCNHLQDAISLDLEPLRSRLWVLDKGNLRCSPKLVIYNLVQKVNYSLEAPEEYQSKINCLVVDNDHKLNDIRGYIGLNESPHLLIFSLNEFKWWKIKLENSGSNLAIATNYLTFSRKEPILFFTGAEDRGLFSVNLNLMRTKHEDGFVNVTFLGEKLGASTSLVADFKNGLSYYIPRDFVVVRWDTRKPPRAEFYNVLAQSYELLPYVSQVFTGPQNGIWALVNPGSSNSCSENPLLVEKRTIKLLKYNIFL